MSTEPSVMPLKGGLCDLCPRGARCGFGSDGVTYCYEKTAATHYQRTPILLIITIVVSALLLVAGLAVAIAHHWAPDSRFGRLSSRAVVALTAAFYWCCCAAGSNSIENV
ncbi:hypothetical protein CAEBREN_04969 [Caenorhabditis brenneri]|uniref:Uncharacterized protein n=1 Tax=Caenorhabditis brenneri TaxID=135651 RepID=G0NBA5_CAEBE|nr:hypothetical protein CAEBREN_04969 [Caenorhabditis brenneri]